MANWRFKLSKSRSWPLLRSVSRSSSGGQRSMYSCLDSSEGNTRPGFVLPHTAEFPYTQHLSKAVLTKLVLSDDGKQAMRLMMPPRPVLVPRVRRNCLRPKVPLASKETLAAVRTF